MHRLLQHDLSRKIGLYTDPFSVVVCCEASVSERPDFKINKNIRKCAAEQSTADRRTASVREGGEDQRVPEAGGAIIFCPHVSHEKDAHINKVIASAKTEAGDLN